MARYSAGIRSTGAGSTTLPVGAIAASASVAFIIYEIGVFNTTTTAVALKLARLTTAGTPGTGLTESPLNPAQPTATATGFDTYTSTGPTLVDLGYRTDLGAAIGAGMVWTFDDGIYVPAGTANGVGIVVATGTGQVLDWYVVWGE